jgi:predicted deacylase
MARDPKVLEELQAAADALLTVSGHVNGAVSADANGDPKKVADRQLRRLADQVVDLHRQAIALKARFEAEQTGTEDK